MMKLKDNRNPDILFTLSEMSVDLQEEIGVELARITKWNVGGPASEIKVELAVRVDTCPGNLSPPRTCKL